MTGKFPGSSQANEGKICCLWERTLLPSVARVVQFYIIIGLLNKNNGIKTWLWTVTRQTMVVTSLCNNLILKWISDIAIGLSLTLLR